MEHSIPKPSVNPAPRFVLAWLAVVILGGGILFPSFTLFAVTWSNGGINWINRAYETKTRCLSKRPSSAGPRLLIFGGSASIFGLDAELMEDELGVHTINFATGAGLGLDYHISRIKRCAQSGDSVLLCLELESFSDEAMPNKFLRAYAFSFDKAYIFELEPRVMLSFLFLATPAEYTESINRWNERLTGYAERNASPPSEGYSVLKMSPNGDFRGLAPEKPFAAGAPAATFSAHARAAMEGLVHWCDQHHVRLLYTWPNRVPLAPLNDTNQFRFHAQVAKFCRDQNIPIIGTPEESVYPKELFIDSYYHLNEIGQRIRTEKLIPHLREVFGMQPLAAPRILCIMASRNFRAHQRGIFQKNESVSYKYLSEASISHPDCIIAGDLRKISSSGIRVVCLDDATEQIAEKGGIRFHEISRRESSFADWIKRYDHHLFLLSLVGMDRCPVSVGNLPEPFAQFLSGEGYRAGIIGTGPWKKANRISRGPELAKLGKRRFDALSTPVVFRYRIDMRSGPTPIFDKSAPPIWIEGESLADLTPGLAVAVIDPYLGILEAQGTFHGEPLLEWKLRQMDIP